MQNQTHMQMYLLAAIVAIMGEELKGYYTLLVNF